MSTTETLDLVVGPGEFIQLRPELVRALGGEPDAAMVLTLIKWKIDPQYRHVYQHDGYNWWVATLDDLCDRTGMTLSRVRRAMKALTAVGLIVGEKHRLEGAYDHAISYRLGVDSDADAPGSLVPTDLSSATNRNVEDDKSFSRRQQIELSPATDLLSVKTLRNPLNGDSVTDAHGFYSTPKRIKLMTDAMVGCGQAHNVLPYLSWLWDQSYEVGRERIRRWCGVHAAVKNGEARANLDWLLEEAGLAPVTDEDWAVFLATPPAGAQHGAFCHFEESGYCLEHGLREDHEHV